MLGPAVNGARTFAPLIPPVPGGIAWRRGEPEPPLVLPKQR